MECVSGKICVLKEEVNLLKMEYPVMDSLACSGTQWKGKEEKQWDDEMEERHAEQCSSSALCII